VIRRAALPAGALILALVAAACALAWEADSPLVPLDGGHVQGTAPLFLCLLVGAFAAYLAGLFAIRRTAPSKRAVVVFAAAIQLVPLAAPLLLSTDAWTYWSYGWIGSRGGGNPYADAPEQFPANPALPYMGADWVDTTSVYGPAFTIASEPLAAASGSSEWVAAWTYKTIAAAAALAAALLAGRLATRRQAFAVALVGWNPLLAVHLAGGGHNDAWVGALILAALALSAARRPQSSGVLWALAVFVKWVPLVFLALVAIEDTARRRRFGLRGLASTAAAVVLAATVLYGGSWLDAVLPLARNASLETSYAIPHRLEQLGVPDTLSLVLAGAALVLGFAWLAVQARRGRARMALAACLVLVTTPYLAVWYLAWAVPLAAAEEDTAATIGCLALCAYLLPQTIPT
jgi:hypothetical protein